jgi:hypothetical protein
MQNTGLLAKIGEGNMLAGFREAVERAREIMGSAPR